jgi:selenocysteine lyase/cysteine desulfurase
MRESSSRRSFLARLGRGSAAAALLPALDASDLAAIADAPPLRPPRTEEDESYWRLVRAQFPIKPGLVPMNAANLCPAPATVIDATVRAAADVDGDVSFQNRAKYDELREDVRARLARYLGAQPDEIAIVRNTSEANNIIVGGVPIGAGDEVVVSDLNHPTNNVAWEVRAKRYGFAVRRVSFPATPRGAQQILDAFEAALNARTKVLSFTDVSNSTGVRMPTRALCALGRERGIHVHVDGAQTFGGLRRDMTELGCASYSASSHKWFLGPKEAGVLYVRSERAAAIWPGVVGVGWGSGPETELAGARRFETLGQRNDATTAGMAAALDFHELIGAERIEARMLAVAGALCDGLAKIPGARLVTSADPALRAGVCIVSFEGVQPRELHEALYTKHAIAGAPTGGLRLSPHIYNTMDDVERVVQAVRGLRG